MRRTETGDGPIPDTAVAQDQETGAAATRIRGELPRWVVPALVVVALVLAIANIVVFDGSAGGWIVLAAIIVTAIGVSIAVNPRRRSIAGGHGRALGRAATTIAPLGGRPPHPRP